MQRSETVFSPNESSPTESLYASARRVHKDVNPRANPSILSVCLTVMMLTFSIV